MSVWPDDGRRHRREPVWLRVVLMLLWTAMVIVGSVAVELSGVLR